MNLLYKLCSHSSSLHLAIETSKKFEEKEGKLLETKMGGRKGSAVRSPVMYLTQKFKLLD